jgi:hypothetical protein
MNYQKLYVTTFQLATAMEMLVNCVDNDIVSAKLKSEVNELINQLREILK